MKQKLKGFTLLELIIVMAMFSIIMYSAVQLLTPVSKFFVRSSNFENTTACVDNMRRCIEGNLKYADRVRAYSGCLPYTYTNTNLSTGNAFQDVELSAELINNVKEFYTLFFEGRKFLDTSGKIYVLVFDNSQLITDKIVGGKYVDYQGNELGEDSDLVLKNYSKLSDYTGKKVNQGKLVLITFEFDNYPELTPGSTARNTADTVASVVVDADGKREYPDINIWSVNQKLYGNFDYQFSMNALSDAAVDYAKDHLIVTTASGAATSSTSATTSIDEHGSVVTAAPPRPTQFFNPQDFNITITCREIRKSSSGLYRFDSNTPSVASFSMKNVLNAADGYRTASLDYKPIMAASEDESTAHSYTVKAIDRYSTMTTKTDFDGFYFIFTNPEDIHDVPGAKAEEFFNNQNVILSESMAAASSTAAS